MSVRTVLAVTVISCLPALSGSTVIQAGAGTDVLLPCSVQHQDGFNLSDVTINWERPDTIVYSFYYGSGRLEHQDKAFRGRTQLFPKEFSKGNASLLLQRVNPADTGNYSCNAVLWANTQHTVHTVSLRVTAQMQTLSEGALSTEKPRVPVASASNESPLHMIYLLL
ncbi:PREDICTED: CD276 antigen-like isoform X2 [Gavialis gangeticus]|uniref:CD276 antigen-like isoform X2 n=1 Tax=Gavialis gangeticus TaxID=94835 RepID=UPI00092E4BE5|nr:PREDICTED: CD276 antigen-like isoform X2 [Gavialis gangeticus]